MPYKAQIITSSADVNLKLITDNKVELDISIPRPVIEQFLDTFSFVKQEEVKVLYDADGNDCLDEKAVKRNEQAMNHYIEEELTSTEIISFLKEFIRCL